LINNSQGLYANSKAVLPSFADDNPFYFGSKTWADLIEV